MNGKNDSSGSIFSTFACGTMQLDQWTAIFGFSDPAKSGSESSDEDDESKFWFAEPVFEPSRPKQYLPPKPNDAVSCDPDSCRAASGICVDCTRCTNHCECPAAETEVFVPFRVFDCNPVTCKQLVCGGCSKCTDHCTCKWDSKGRSDHDHLRLSPLSNSRMEGLRKKLSWAHLHRKGEF